MDSERLAEIEARAKAATEGPWKCWDGWRGGGHYFARRIGPDTGGGLKSSNDGDLVALLQDLEFCAHARQDISDLIAEVRRLREEVDKAQPYIRAWHRGAGAPP